MKVQAILEEACYAFGHKMMGDILQKEGWDCPESVELNIWARVFRCNEDKFDAEKLLELGKPFPELLDSIAQLRHTADEDLQYRSEALKGRGAGSCCPSPCSFEYCLGRKISGI